MTKNIMSLRRTLVMFAWRCRIFPKFQIVDLQKAERLLFLRRTEKKEENNEIQSLSY
jgi:hypothetical protein